MCSLVRAAGSLHGIIWWLAVKSVTIERETELPKNPGCTYYGGREVFHFM
jgi:hypothetical protein